MDGWMDGCMHYRDYWEGKVCAKMICISYNVSKHQVLENVSSDSSTLCVYTCMCVWGGTSYQYLAFFKLD